MCDYKNSIKESITAVETLCKIYVGDDSATLDSALSKLSKVKNIHPAFKDSMIKLYGFSCDESGIRHGGYTDVRDITFEDAEYILVTCSAFINYIISISSTK